MFYIHCSSKSTLFLINSHISFIQPENIMLVNKDSTQIKVIDFGEARRMGPDVKTMSHTLGYASPEVLNYEPVCPATDMWTIGLLITS